MRQWMRLFEDSLADTVKKMVPHDSMATAGHGYDQDGNDFEITDQHVAAMKERIERILRTPTIYRYVLLPEAQLARYLSGPLGTFWCHDQEINLQALTGWDSAGEDALLYRLTATVTPSDVEMARTILQNLAVPWENEITVRAGAPLMLRSVDLLPDFECDDTPVRQQIVPGRRMA